MMTREGATIVVVAVTLLMLGLMFWGWRSRIRRDAGLQAPVQVPAGDVPAVAEPFEGFYVATTVHDAPLERLAVKHLTYRGRVRAVVRGDGVVLEIAGEPTIFLAAAAIAGVGRATWAIDRVVERDGLVLLAWRIDSGENDLTIVDSYLRLPGGADAFVAAVETILPTPAPTTGSAA